MDAALADARCLRVALRLIGRLGFVTDAPDAWKSLPDQLTVYRAESDPGMGGMCWTLTQEVADMHARVNGLVVSEGRVAKRDVLAFITGYGEDEIVAPREAVS